MGTRSGDVDASIVSFVSEEYNLKAIVSDFQQKLRVLGISGISSDMRI